MRSRYASAMAEPYPAPTPAEPTPALAAEVTGLAARAAAHDAVAPLNEEALLGLRHPDPARRHWVTTLAGAVVGYATTSRGAGQLVVDPAHRRHGVGTELLGSARASTPGTELHWWAFGNTAPARALAARRGASAVRTLLKLGRPLAGLPAPRPLPPNTGLRAFRPGSDDAALLAVNARAFASHPEQGRMSRADLEARFAETWFDPAGLLLAVDADDETRVLGFHWTKLEPGAAEGEVYVLGVDPDVHGGGLGGALLDAGLAHLVAQGATAVDLYVEGDNTAALALYTRGGFAEISRDVMYA